MIIRKFDIIRSGLALLALSFMTYTAQSADLGGPLEPIVEKEPQAYVIVRGGAAFSDDTDFGIQSLGFSDVENEYDTGFFVSGAVGTSLTEWTGMAGLRGEIEFGYLESEIDSHTLDGAVTFDGGDAFGETSAFFGLASLYYDIPLGTRVVKPFIGGGIGFGQVEFEGHGVTASGVVMDDEDTGFAFHGTAGANIEIADNVSAEVGYRYFEITDVELTSEDNVESSIDFGNHIVYGGLKYKF